MAAERLAQDSTNHLVAIHSVATGLPIPAPSTTYRNCHVRYLRDQHATKRTGLLTGPRSRSLSLLIRCLPWVVGILHVMHCSSHPPSMSSLSISRSVVGGQHRHEVEDPATTCASSSSSSSPLARRRSPSSSVAFLERGDQCTS